MSGIENRLAGTKNSVQDMLYYYAVALLDNGVDDPKQYIATQIPDMIDISVEQARYISSQLSVNKKTDDNFKNCIKLLESAVNDIENGKKVDATSLSLVIKVLNKMKKEFKEARERYSEHEY